MFVYSIARKPKKGGQMIPVTVAEVSQEIGIFGDCRGGGLTKERQVTIISLEQWREVRQELGCDLSVHARRSNLCISGHSFGPEDVGKELSFSGGLVLKITGETTSCARMDKILLGLCSALSKNWRGGVNCRVIHHGILSLNQQLVIR